jgi:hypothetical protein
MNPKRELKVSLCDMMDLKKFFFMADNIQHKERFFKKKIVNNRFFLQNYLHFSFCGVTLPGKFSNKKSEESKNAENRT